MVSQLPAGSLLEVVATHNLAIGPKEVLGAAIRGQVVVVARVLGDLEREKGGGG